MPIKMNDITRNGRFSIVQQTGPSIGIEVAHQLIKCDLIETIQVNTALLAQVEQRSLHRPETALRLQGWKFFGRGAHIEDAKRCVYGQLAGCHIIRVENSPREREDTRTNQEMLAVMQQSPR